MPPERAHPRGTLARFVTDRERSPHKNPMMVFRAVSMLMLLHVAMCQTTCKDGTPDDYDCWRLPTRRAAFLSCSGHGRNCVHCICVSSQSSAWPIRDRDKIDWFHAATIELGRATLPRVHQYTCTRLARSLATLHSSDAAVTPHLVVVFGVPE